MTTVTEVVRAGFPNAGDDLADDILWSRTPYPAGRVNARSLYKAASSLYRAMKRGITLCDFCERPAEPEQWTCKQCGDFLRKRHAA